MRLERTGVGAAVDQQVLPGEVTGLCAAQEGAGGAEFIRRAEAAGGNLLAAALGQAGKKREHLVQQFRHPRRIGQHRDARGARVDYALGSRDDYAFHDDPLSAGGLKASYPDIRERDVYLCGSPGMMARVERSLREIGVPRGQIHLERFSW